MQNNICFDQMQVDPAIQALLDNAQLNAKAVQTSKQCRTARTNNKRDRQAHNKKARKENGFHKKIRMSEYEFMHRLRSANNECKKADNITMAINRSQIPSNHNKHGYSGFSQDWNKEARTGIKGKPHKRPAANDHRYSAHPYVPYTK